MPYSLIIAARASKDVEKAIAYYDAINTDLGNRFLNELSDIYLSLSVNPNLYSLIGSSRKRKVRDVKLKSFPFVVIFEIRAGSVSIISVFNSHRKPLY